MQGKLVESFPCCLSVGHVLLKSLFMILWFIGYQPSASMMKLVREDSEKYQRKVTNSPGTAGGPDGRDRTLALKSKKMLENLCVFFRKK